MTSRFAYITPIHEDNQAYYPWCKVGQFWARLCDEKGEYDGDALDTRKEAIETVKFIAKELGWNDYEISFDE